MQAEVIIDISLHSTNFAYRTSRSLTCMLTFNLVFQIVTSYI